MIKKLSEQQIIEELRRRQAKIIKESETPKFVFSDIAFEAQTKFFRSEGGRFRTAVCSRRSGKTFGIAADAIATCLEESNVVCLYITLSKRNARSIIWDIAKQIIKDFNIPAVPNEVELSIRFDNGSKLAIEGAKDKTEIEKYRGWKIKKCYIDECQSFRSYIKDLINDIIIPALRDLRGQLYLTGTPGPVPAGYFYDASHSDMWENFHWTAFDNPHMHNPPEKDLEITLSEERALKNISHLDPSYRRETYGEWVEDLDSLVYKYDEALNHYDELPKAEYVYIMGIDIGYEDSDAIAILAYSKEHNKVYLVEEHIKAKQTISQLAEAIHELDAIYNCTKKVIDAGALGKKITEEIIQRYGINLEAADKARKVEYIELLNADLRKGVVKAKKTSRFAEDCKLVTWDKDRSTSERRKISDTVHSDVQDSVLYSYREARHYLYEAPKPKHHRNTNEYMKELEDREAQELAEASSAKNMLTFTTEEANYYEALFDDIDLDF